MALVRVPAFPRPLLESAVGRVHRDCGCRAVPGCRCPWLPARRWRALRDRRRLVGHGAVVGNLGWDRRGADSHLSLASRAAFAATFTIGRTHLLDESAMALPTLRPVLVSVAASPATGGVLRATAVRSIRAGTRKPEARGRLPRHGAGQLRTHGAV